MCLLELRWTHHSSKVAQRLRIRQEMDAPPLQRFSSSDSVQPLRLGPKTAFTTIRLSDLDAGNVSASGAAHSKICCGCHAATLFSCVVVGERGGQLAVGPPLGQKRVGLGLKRLRGVGAGSESGGRILERGELHDGGGELGGVATLLPIHALPGRDDFLCLLSIVVDTIDETQPPERLGNSGNDAVGTLLLTTTAFDCSRGR